MNIIRIIIQIAILYVFLLIGNVAHTYLHIPLPGSIIGLLLLFLALSQKIFSVKWIEQGASFLLAFLPLLFVPTLVGIIKYPELFYGKGILVLLVVIISTVMTIIAAGRASQFIESKTKDREEKKKCHKHSSQSL
ncbi:MULTISPECIES: CidA/LrgA family holin-like protein [Bacillus]|uniref:CidA/LrgA family holin-like protein n=1 Tax=Bacillus TaxID=1386 RepID=UPI0002D86FFD|nr:MULTISPECIES: CidA/LrgA family holin-like protein [Bacillus]